MSKLACRCRCRCVCVFWFAKVNTTHFIIFFFFTLFEIVQRLWILAEIMIDQSEIVVNGNLAQFIIRSLLQRMLSILEGYLDFEERREGMVWLRTKRGGRRERAGGDREDGGELLPEEGCEQILNAGNRFIFNHKHTHTHTYCMWNPFFFFFTFVHITDFHRILECSRQGPLLMRFIHHQKVDTRSFFFFF